MANGVTCGSIYKTKDYSAFIIDPVYNREVDVKHVKKLTTCYKTIGDFGEAYPIVVDENMRIVDGQHRYTARKELGLPIYYIQSIELSSDKLGLINDAMKKWSQADYTKLLDDNPVIKKCKLFAEQFGLLFDNVLKRGANVSSLKNMIKESSEKNLERINKLELIKPYVEFLISNLKYKKIGSSRSLASADIVDVVTEDAIIGLSNKLLRYKVKIADLPSDLLYQDMIAYLYQNKLVK